MFLEVIYENGEHSIMQVDSEEEGLEGVREQHRRATMGERGLQGDPNSPPAVRVKRVFAYDAHPGSFGENNKVDAKEALAAVEGLKEGDAISVPELVQALRNLTNPRLNSAPHESNFIMEHAKEIKAEKWEVAA